MDVAPQIDLTNTDGEAVSLESFSGAPLIVQFARFYG